MLRSTIISVCLFSAATASAASDPDYRGEFFSWVWMPCMYQLAEDAGAGVAEVDDAAMRLHNEMHDDHFNKNAWETEKLVTDMPTNERAEVYRYLRNECAGGYVDSAYLPSWELGEPFQVPLGD